VKAVSDSDRGPAADALAVCPPATPAAHESAARRTAAVIRDAFATHQQQFGEITRRAARRQEQRDWHGMQRDAVERLDLHGRSVRRAVADVERMLGGARRRDGWADAKAAYLDLVADRPDRELAQTFFNSVARRVFGTVGADPLVEYGADAFGPADPAPTAPLHATYAWRGDGPSVVRGILVDRPLTVGYRDVEGDAALIADRIEAHCRTVWGADPIDVVEMLHPVLYRNKGAYLVGRIRGQGPCFRPLVIALVNDGGRMVADAVLLTEDEASIVFSFTRSAFHVDVEGPRRVIDFLKTIMPAKRMAELYIALGYHKHGKGELYRDLARHLAASTDRFETAPGDPGMVMLVFTLPSYEVVFKVIRDAFAYPKTVTRRQVIERYQLVFQHDRAGRLVDAQEFEHFAFPRHRFSESLLAELTESAAGSVVVEGDRVIVRHLYTERRVTPLNLYLREADDGTMRDVVLDYGRAIRDMAATNIFPGDLLLKNFGVTRHGRVIFYDYDELCLLTDCNFREMPEPRTVEEEMAAEPWFYVGPHDMFPEEFLTFMGLYGDMREVFLETHGELLTAGFWRRMQDLHRAGEVIDIFPYRLSRRLR
jgi:isocitrate dehydrogenase kinase/phosphatase